MFRAISKAASLSVAIASILSMPSPSLASQSFDRIVAFGDSLTDCGTFGFIYATNPGMTWAQFVASHYGQDLSSNRKVKEYGDVQLLTNPQGLCYAEGGSRIAEPNGTNPDQSPLPVKRQVENYISQHKSFGDQDLVLIFIGGNDIVSPFSDEKLGKKLVSGTGISNDEWAALEKDMEKYAGQEVKAIESIWAQGAKHIVVLNNMDYGKAPYQKDWSNAAALNTDKLVLSYNAALKKALPQNPDIALVDTYTFFNDIIANHEKYGFTYASGADACKGEYHCLPKGYAEPNANETYMFGGYGHFTVKTHKLLADFVIREAEKAWPDRQ